MALRYTISGLPKGLKPCSVLEPAPAVRAPVDVRFRRGADLAKVADEVLDYPSVRVLAAVNAGKSSGVPKQLALRSGRLTLYVAASPLLALDAYDYACKMANEGHVYPPLHRFFERCGLELPRTGLMFCSGAEYVRILIDSKVAGIELAPHVVFLDEAHRSDAFTQICRALALKFGASNLVQASATFDMEAGIRREGGGEVQGIEYTHNGPVADWVVSDEGKPWSFSGLRNNIAVFTDSRSEAAHLVSEYSMNGVPAFRLTGASTQREYKVAKHAALDAKGPNVALILDSTYRDGFDLPVARIVDTGLIGFYQHDPAGVVRAYRPLFHLERVQTSGRLARHAGQKAEYYYPQGEYPRMACDLEGTEMEAAAYFYRILGFMPTGDIAEAVMARDVLPDEYDFSTVIQAKYPLPYYVRDARGRPRTPPPVDVQPPSYVSVVSEQGDQVPQEPYEEKRGRKRDSGVEVTSVQSRSSSRSSCGESGFTHAVGRMRDGAPRAVDVSEGDYLQVSYPHKVQPCDVYFPRGFESLCTYLPEDKTPVELRAVIARFRPEVRDRALELVVSEYNVGNAYCRAIRSALRRVYADQLHERQGPGFQDELSGALESLNSMELRMKFCFSRVMLLADGYLAVRPLGGFVDMEEQQSDRFYARFASLVASEYDDERDRRAVKSRVDKSSRGMTDHCTYQRSTMRTVTDGEVVRSYEAAAWTGVRRVVERGGSSKWADTTVEFNAFGRMITGIDSLSVGERGMQVDRRGTVARRRFRRSESSRVSEVD